MSKAWISFDVFDTIITRCWAEPHDLFVELGARLQSIGISSDIPMDFARKRVAAETIARRKSPEGEALLSEIYGELSSALGWSTPQCARAQDEEIALESAGIRAVPAMHVFVTTARQITGQMLFISDTYFPSAVIQAWLEKHAFWQPGDFLFVSAEYRVSKGREGALFARIQQQLGIDWKHWTHHGDNARADIAQARRRGISPVIQSTARLTESEHLLRGSDPFATTWRSQLAGAARLARLESTTADESERILWDTGADIAGPLFYAFTDWCLFEAEKRGVHDLYFLARGGQIFLRIAEEIQNARPRPVRLHYLPASRLAFATDLAATDSNRTAAEHRELARAFLKQSGLAGNSRVALVDTGWHGTIQLGLESLLGNDQPKAVPGFYFGLMEGRPQATGWQAGYINTFAPLPLREELSLCVLIEHLARADHGLMRGFTPLPTGEVVPQFDDQASAINRQIRLCQDGCLAFVDAFLRAEASTGPVAPREMAVVAVECFRQFHDHPNRSIAQLFGGIPHMNDPAGQCGSAICVEPQIGPVLRAMLAREHRPIGWWLPAQAALGQHAVVRCYQALRKIKQAFTRRKNGLP